VNVGPIASHSQVGPAVLAVVKSTLQVCRTGQARMPQGSSLQTLHSQVRRPSKLQAYGTCCSVALVGNLS
jgi:hypothetical protein